MRPPAMARALVLTAAVLAVCLTAAAWHAAPAAAAVDHTPDHATFYYDPSAHEDEARAVAVGLDQSIYVAGTLWDPVDLSLDASLVKLSPVHAAQWLILNWGEANLRDSASQVVVAGDGSVYVAGEMEFSDIHAVFVRKYTAGGASRWLGLYYGLLYGQCYANDLKVDADGNAFLAVQFSGPDGSDDAALIKYSADGNQQWVKKYAGPSHGDAVWYEIVTAGRQIYVVGTSDTISGVSRSLVARYTTAGQRLWLHTTGTSRQRHRTLAAAPVPAGGVYAAGLKTGAGGRRGLLISYRADGRRRWVRTYAGLWGGERAEFLDVAVDPRNGSVALAGHSLHASEGFWRFYVLMCNSKGSRRWAYTQAPKVAAADAYASQVQISSTGQVYAAGSLETGSGTVAEDVFQTYICELTDAGSPVWFDWWPAAAVARCDPADMALSGG
ncbi:MAG: hypothetical protein IMZ74_18925, partial [Actinobacteria bacterium]|nr:hypothetical protein [Actinomycetota bacterium]